MALVAIVVAAYWRTVHGTTVWDDEFLTTRNPYLAPNAHAFSRLLTSDLWMASAKEEPSGYFRPVAMATFALNRWIGGNTPFSYHVGNVVLHALTCVALWMWLRLVAPRARLVTWFAALAVGVLPITSEPVAWLAGRFDIVGTALALVALILHRRGAHAAWIAIAFAAATLSKEPFVVLPAIMFVDDALLKRWEGARSKYASLTFAFLVCVGLRHAAHIGDLPPSAHISAARALESYVECVRTLAAAAASPSQLSIVHVYRAPPVSTTIAGALVIFGVVALFATTALRHPSAATRDALLGVIWALVALVPAGLAAPRLFQTGDRYAYFALSGVGTTICAVCAGVSGLRWARVAFGIGLGAIAAASIRPLERRLAEWSSAETLYTAELARDPGRYWVGTLLGDIRIKQGRFTEAEQLLVRAHRDGAVPWPSDVSLCYLYLHENRLDEALAQCDEAVAVNPNDPRAWLNRASVALRARRFQAALDDADQALRVKPHYAEGHYVRALALANIGRVDDALTEARAALEVNPNHAGASALLSQLETSPSAQP